MEVINIRYLLLFLIGFGLSVAGGVTLIAYLNFLPAGILWVDYLLFIKGRVECYFLPIGLCLIGISIANLTNIINGKSSTR